MSNVRILVAALAAATLVGCDGTNPLSPKTITPGSVVRQAMVGDVVYLKIDGNPAPIGTVFLIKSYRPLAEPLTCTSDGVTTYTFVGEVTAVAPGYTTGPGMMGGSEVYLTSMELAPNTKLRVDTVPVSTCGGSFVQATVVE